MKTAIPRDYSLIAPVYDHIFQSLLSEGHKKIGQLIRKRKNGQEKLKVLEVGVGSGLTLMHLPRNIDYCGVDINEKMLTLARHKTSKQNRKDIRLETMDAHALKFPANTFDLVAASSVVSAVATPDMAIKEMIRVTKKGGQIAIIVNLRNQASRKSRMVEHLTPITQKFLGFRTDLGDDYFKRFKRIKLIEQKSVNSLMGLPLSSYLLFEKT